MYSGLEGTYHHRREYGSEGELKGGGEPFFIGMSPIDLLFLLRLLMLAFFLLPTSPPETEVAFSEREVGEKRGCSVSYHDSLPLFFGPISRWKQSGNKEAAFLLPPPSSRPSVPFVAASEARKDAS